jgi:hypothetical protein
VKRGSLKQITFLVRFSDAGIFPLGVFVWEKSRNMLGLSDEIMSGLG